MKIRPRFTLKALLLVITCFGIWLGWLMHSVRIRREYQRRKELAGWIFTTSDSVRDTASPTNPVPEIWFVRRMLGDRAIYGISIPKFGEKVFDYDDEIPDAKKVFPETWVSVYVLDSPPHQ